MASRLPKGAWDSHIHAIDKVKFPMKEDRPFTPKQATVEQAVSFEKSLGIDHVNIIASSIYGTDNSCLIDALTYLNGKGRGIAYIDPATVTDAELDALHKVGVRGVRLNLWTRSLAFDPKKWVDVLESYAAKLRRLNWVLQIYVSMDQIPNVAPIIPTLGVKVVFDHLGCPNAGSVPAKEQKGAQELYSLLQNKNDVFIKLSGEYRMNHAPKLDEHIKHLLKIVPNQIVWASDWPHTGGMKNNPGGDPKAEQDFLEVDVLGFLNQCLDWCGNDELIKKIWVDNPRRLWDYPYDD